MRASANSKLDATILVDSAGMTLYRLGGESNGKFICTSQSCLAVWHPLKPSGGASPTGAASLGTVKRPDGIEQVTYQGAPLYTFSPDKTAGETNGQGLKDVGTWSVVKVSGGGGGSSPAASTQPGPAPEEAEESSSSSGSGSGGYAY